MRLTLAVKQAYERLANAHGKATLTVKLNTYNEASVWTSCYCTRWSYAWANIKVKHWVLNSPTWWS